MEQKTAKSNEMNEMKSCTPELQWDIFGDSALGSPRWQGLGATAWRNHPSPILAFFQGLTSILWEKYIISHWLERWWFTISKFPSISWVFFTHRGEVHLSEFKPLMLASLRSLVPKGWDSHHEAAWASWWWKGGLGEMGRLGILNTLVVDVIFNFDHSYL